MYKLPVAVVGDEPYTSELVHFFMEKNAEILPPESLTHSETGGGLVYLFSEDYPDSKGQLLAGVEKVLGPSMPILVNLEGLTLEELQQHMDHPERLLGANFAQPVLQTPFLEIICNDRTDPQVTERVRTYGSTLWGKDPVVSTCGFSVQARLFAAMVREAFYLVENGYASVRSIDRSCRNDAGYYLTFAGNFRYMDLMGPYAYGRVMKDLNPELSNADALPDWFTSLVASGHDGMSTLSGFYSYEEQPLAQWKDSYASFSRDMESLMGKYRRITDKIRNA